MLNSEFSLIQRYFAQQNMDRSDVLLGIGDDAALLRSPFHQELVVSLDMLVAGRHFFLDADPYSVGHKSLAVNLSDLAAMGAEPAWFTLAIALPEVDEHWLTGFCQGLFRLAQQFGVQLVGGDTTRGALTIAIQAHGWVPQGQALRRDGARPGDIIFVTGTLGDAGLALAAALKQIDIPVQHKAYLQARLDRPSPRIQQGRDLRGLASAAIDISDGLAQDLGHILERSQVGARLAVDDLPRSSALAVSHDVAIATQLGAGDDYELCFCVPPERVTQLQTLTQSWDCACTRIGIIEAELGLRCCRGDGSDYHIESTGYDHFC